MAPDDDEIIMEDGLMDLGGARAPSGPGGGRIDFEQQLPMQTVELPKPEFAGFPNASQLKQNQFHLDRNRRMRLLKAIIRKMDKTRERI
jgi:hypothetical protein